MKRILGLIFVLTVVVSGIFLFGRTKKETFSESSAETGNRTARETVFDGVTYQYALFKVDDLSKLNLIANFDTKKKADDVYKKNGCRYLANGGFYAEGGKPIGLFVSNEEEQNGWVANRLFDGILSVNDFNTPRITRSVPEDHLIMAVQTGPVIKENDGLVKLAVRNDKPERRMLAGVDGSNALYFLTVYQREQNFSGPLLNKLPRVLEQIEKNEGIVMADAVNLDGGTASSFITPDLNLTELTLVGSFFCLR